ncbi:hypothetical protein [Vreelandella rituensis]|uniref:Uncharacterized protein n=1 Tax=Vreelandella rituensis TaxID=2282306 RepID=A0A368TN55_9GAMM|nr:hypothetical protein [Halomonas rituensis]RCV86031.1 hypothetical protein DU506_19270 [Halomonas rituensis]
MSLIKRLLRRHNWLYINPTERWCYDCQQREVRVDGTWRLDQLGKCHRWVAPMPDKRLCTDCDRLEQHHRPDRYTDKWECLREGDPRRRWHHPCAPFLRLVRKPDDGFWVITMGVVIELYVILTGGEVVARERGWKRHD